MDSLRISTTVQDGKWKVSVQVEQGDMLPTHIFIHENTGTETLGRYVGVCNFDELCRLPQWSGAVVKKFGNRFVRADSAEFFKEFSSDLQKTIDYVVSGASTLKVEMQSQLDRTDIVPV